MCSNNPFVLTEPVDASTYSRDLSNLPVADTFAPNADRTVAADLGFPGTEAVMQQGAFRDEDQRQLATDDIATLRLGMTGLDRTTGTSDDYRPVLVFDGVGDDCDITVQLTATSFAFCSIGAVPINGNSDHVRVNNAPIQLGSYSSFNWHFKQNLVVVLDEVFFVDGFED